MLDSALNKAAGISRVGGQKGKANIRRTFNTYQKLIEHMNDEQDTTSDTYLVDEAICNCFKESLIGLLGPGSHAEEEDKEYALHTWFLLQACKADRNVEAHCSSVPTSQLIQAIQETTVDETSLHPEQLEALKLLVSKIHDHEGGEFRACLDQQGHREPIDFFAKFLKEAVSVKSKGLSCFSYTDAHFTRCKQECDLEVEPIIHECSNNFKREFPDDTYRQLFEKLEGAANRYVVAKAFQEELSKLNEPIV
ncbi:hypothetical protein CYMTET_9205 [Cymbomonas tetramitiformis]|uniref:Uncharacterized protein n=1 Tax=Cymbomonas tetramitiformis TaxID=36881 RepID=A0AAE0GTA4_9CHLO|nr:hypothetical protein CYMTET_9205 [Cymbomonas tetramitiformis]